MQIPRYSKKNRTRSQIDSYTHRQGRTNLLDSKMFILVLKKSVTGMDFCLFRSLQGARDWMKEKLQQASVVYLQLQTH